MLQTENLVGLYKGAFGVVRAVDEVSLTVNRNEIMGLAGESGCGKSTYTKLLTGTPVPLLYYESGKVLVEGYDIWNTPPEVLRKEVKCKLISYVPQAALDALNPTLRLRQLVRDMLKERTGRKYSEKEAREFLAEHFEELNLDRYVLDLYPHELSGGMKQRAVIAISTYAKPSLLLADEPASSLDVSSQRDLIEMLLDMHRKEMIKSMLVSSHDLCVLRQICDRLAIMYAGKIVEVGSMEEIVNNPLHPYAELLLKSALPLERWTKHEKMESIWGKPPDLRNPPPGCRFHPRCPHVMDICKTRMPPDLEIKRRHVQCWLSAEEYKK